MEKYIHIKTSEAELYAPIEEANEVGAALSKYRINVDLESASTEVAYEREFINWYWEHKGAELIRIKEGKYLYLVRKNLNF